VYAELLARMIEQNYHRCIGYGIHERRAIGADVRCAGRDEGERAADVVATGSVLRTGGSS
jgi:hypothetical protein